jgi:predicted O-methyltransferase YrrM
MLGTIVKGLRYLLLNPRYTFCYFYSRPQSLLRFVAGQPARRFFELQEELKADPDFVRLIREKMRRRTQHDFVLNQDHCFLYALVRLTKPHLVLETGVFDGVFSACFLQGLLVNSRNEGTEGRLVSIDLPSYQSIRGSTDQLVRTHLPEGCEPGWLIPEPLRKRWHLHLGDSRDLLPHVSKEVGCIDLFFHDSLHTYEHMSFEYQTVWPLLKPGAILLSHDVHWNRAFCDFVREHKQQDRVAHGFGVIRKT